MFNLFNKPKYKGKQMILRINGMHCSSCSLNIDGELEDLDGVIESNTSYAKSISTITYDPHKVTPSQIRSTITKLGYEVVS